MNEKDNYNIDFQILSRLLEPGGLVPEQDFRISGVLLYTKSPNSSLRNSIRHILGHEITFKPTKKTTFKKMQQLWRDNLSPEIHAEEGSFNFEEEDQLRNIASEAPIINLVNNIIDQAIEMNASDIHFEPGDDKFRVRCRVDGVLINISELPVSSKAAVLSRIKLMAGLDIGEKRLPQDGRIKFPGKEKTVDIRTSTLPGIYGESIVLRILDKSDVSVNLDKLGIPDEILSTYNEIISTPHGMILVTGPTGSGKTTTLYASLHKVYSEKVKIITVEDPVEYEFTGITQVHVRPKIGLTFATGLRSIVRQDPDIILIGEIRDQETASIAVESSLTGHLVLSTLHTNDAPSAITRLQEMGIESYLISSSLLAIMAQRLVRKNCEHCKEEKLFSDREKNIFNLDSTSPGVYYRGKGCEKCAFTGYRGRIGIYEFLPLTDSIRKLIMDGSPATLIKEQALKEGMRTLRNDGVVKLKQGITTPEEVLRVSGGL